MNVTPPPHPWRPLYLVPTALTSQPPSAPCRREGGLLPPGAASGLTPPSTAAAAAAALGGGGTAIGPLTAGQVCPGWLVWHMLGQV